MHGFPPSVILLSPPPSSSSKISGRVIARREEIPSSPHMCCCSSSFPFCREWRIARPRKTLAGYPFLSPQRELVWVHQQEKKDRKRLQQSIKKIERSKGEKSTQFTKLSLSNVSPWLHVVTLLLVRPRGDSSFFFMCVWKEKERGGGDRVETLPRDPK